MWNTRAICIGLNGRKQGREKQVRFGGEVTYWVHILFSVINSSFIFSLEKEKIKM